MEEGEQDETVSPWYLRYRPQVQSRNQRTERLLVKKL